MNGIAGEGLVLSMLRTRFIGHNLARELWQLWFQPALFRTELLAATYRFAPLAALGGGLSVAALLLVTLVAALLDLSLRETIGYAGFGLALMLLAFGMVLQTSTKHNRFWLLYMLHRCLPSAIAVLGLLGGVAAVKPEPAWVVPLLLVWLSSQIVTIIQTVALLSRHAPQLPWFRWVLLFGSLAAVPACSVAGAGLIGIWPVLGVAIGVLRPFEWLTAALTSEIAWRRQARGSPQNTVWRWFAPRHTAYVSLPLPRMVDTVLHCCRTSAGAGANAIALLTQHPGQCWQVGRVVSQALIRDEATTAAALLALGGDSDGRAGLESLLAAGVNHTLLAVLIDCSRPHEAGAWRGVLHVQRRRLATLNAAALPLAWRALHHFIHYAHACLATTDPALLAAILVHWQPLPPVLQVAAAGQEPAPEWADGLVQLAWQREVALVIRDHRSFVEATTGATHDFSTS